MFEMHRLCDGENSCMFANMAIAAIVFRPNTLGKYSVRELVLEKSVYSDVTTCIPFLTDFELASLYTNT